MARITADSNIYISALNFGGLSARVLDLARDGVVSLAVSDAILNELSRVLRDKFGWSESAITEAQALIVDFAEQFTPIRQIDAVPDDQTTLPTTASLSVPILASQITLSPATGIC
jgi:uncharacterized protein